LYDYLSDSLHIVMNRVSVADPGDNITADMALSIGGDGTFLRTAQWIGDRQIPILGINTGHLGYLAEIRLSEAPAMIADILAGNYNVEPRSLLEAIIPDCPADYWPYALNEAAILKKDTSSMITAHTAINGTDLTTYLGDGLIISTPTGSTGYNLSVGGPIIQPTAPNWVISPIAAHSLTMRPLVTSDNERLSVTTTSRAGSYLLSLDGRSLSLQSGTTVEIRRAPFSVHIVQRPGHNFASTLRAKLLWGIDNR
ncbi:MAG: NAD(+)/NADH kinase, partial [Muribaculaceae bacterium]|nr:NAD(+)/NADH kinase [Muribaculaceae bacterium]